MASPFRRPVYVNPSARSWHSPEHPPLDNVRAFHKTLPNYAPTRLIALPDIASQHGVKKLYLKDESQRLGLPSFKILGASWAVFRAIVQNFGLPLESDLSVVKHAASARPTPTTLLAATDGNHGRAVARMGKILGVKARIYVPQVTDEATRRKIEDEGAVVLQVDGSYDRAIQLAFDAEKESSGNILVQDTAFEGYEQIPRWVVEGYGTMLHEIDEQLGVERPDLVIVPVGVGSFAQAVVTHYKAQSKDTKVLAVESDTAACLYKSLINKELVALENTTYTIMAGLDCGTVSSNAWPLLRAGVDASLTVSDFEAHEALNILGLQDVPVGPCGASPLAALRRLSTVDKETLGIDDSLVVVLLCTEGPREYPFPRDVGANDAHSLVQTLVQINSAVPGGGNVPGPGETEIARYVTAWLEHRDIETHWLEPIPGRPSVMGIVRGSGGGKDLMFNGHLDTVTVARYDGDPLSGLIRDNKLYGRGSADMKGGLASILLAVAQAKRERLQGDVIFTGVADEEDRSIGTEQILEAGWKADAAIVCEPTMGDLITAHKGFVWFEVVINGLAAHGSRFDLGVDAISRAGYFLIELDKYAQRLLDGPKHPTLGPGSVHASIVRGGEEPASYPANCTITIERRTVAGETLEQVETEMENLLKAAAQNALGLSYDFKTTFSRPAFEIARDNSLVSLVADQIKGVTGADTNIRTEAFWTDCALLADSGIPVVMYGPVGEGLHSKEEWVDLKSVESVSATLVGVARAFCGQSINTL